MAQSLNLSTLSEPDIIIRILLGEIELYEEIIHRFNNYLYRIGRSYGYGHADVEDLMQETFVTAYINLEQFENRASFKTWIVRIMLNKCYHKRRKSSFINERPFPNIYRTDSEAAFLNDPRDISKLTQNNELKKVLEDALNSIPEDYRMVFRLRELEDMSVRETSEAMHISESNVKVRFHRSKTMLQEEIKKTYSPEEIDEFNLIS